MGSVNQYARMQQLEAHWNLKKQSGDVTGHDSLSDLMRKTPTAAAYQEQVDARNAQQDSKMESIRTKLMTGKPLTADEKKYLQEKDPVAYQKLKAAEVEQAAYEREMRRCRTKEDVQRLRMTKLGSALADVNEVKNNPHMAEKRLERVLEIQNRVRKLEGSFRRYAKSAEYQEKPTDAERTKAMEEENRELVRRLTGEDPDAADMSEKKETTAPESAETLAESGNASRTAGTPSKHRSPAGAKKAPSGEWETPELRKLRRSRRHGYPAPTEETETAWYAVSTEA